VKWEYAQRRGKKGEWGVEIEFGDLKALKAGKGEPCA
jgi:hypothetical protein